MLQPSTPFGASGPALSTYASPRFFLSFFPALKQKGAKKKRRKKKRRRETGPPFCFSREVGFGWSSVAPCVGLATGCGSCQALAFDLKEKQHSEHDSKAPLLELRLEPLRLPCKPRNSDTGNMRWCLSPPSHASCSNCHPRASQRWRGSTSSLRLQGISIKRS